MSETDPVPLLYITRGVNSDGIGGITYTVRPDILPDFLGQFGVSKVRDLSETAIRELCNRASMASQQHLMQKAEELNPGQTAIVLSDGQDAEAEIRSGDVGFDLMMRMTPQQTDDEELKFNPAYSSVRFEMAVYASPVSHVTRTILSMTVEPPNFAG